MEPAGFALLILVTVSGLLDVRRGVIPNAVTYPSCVAGLLLSGAAGGVGLTSSLLGLAVGFAPLFLLYLRGEMGGGDVKLMAAVGALMGYPFVLNALVSAILAGGLLALLVLIWERQLWVTLRFIFDGLRRAVDPSAEPLPPYARKSFPFGAAISLGSYATLVADGLGYISPAGFLS